MGSFDRAGIDGEEVGPEAGIMPRSFSHLFSAVKSQQQRQTGVRFLIRCSFIEIYNEELRDLLTDAREGPPNAKKNKLEIKEGSSQGVYVKDSTVRMARSPRDLLQALKDGAKARAVGDTSMNRESSRSHCIFTILIEMQEELKVFLLIVIVSRTANNGSKWAN